MERMGGRVGGFAIVIEGGAEARTWGNGRGSEEAKIRRGFESRGGGGGGVCSELLEPGAETTDGRRRGSLDTVGVLWGHGVRPKRRRHLPTNRERERKGDKERAGRGWKREDGKPLDVVRGELDHSAFAFTDVLGVSRPRSPGPRFPRPLIRSRNRSGSRGRVLSERVGLSARVHLPSTVLNAARQHSVPLPPSASTRALLLCLSQVSVVSPTRPQAYPRRTQTRLHPHLPPLLEVLPLPEPPPHFT